MDMVGRVRRMRLRDQLSTSEIAKRTGLSRNTVKKWLNAAGDKLPRYRRVKGTTLRWQKVCRRYPDGTERRGARRQRRDLENTRFGTWQIDAQGEYRHPDFGGEGPAMRGFQGYGRMQTNHSGQYRFKTVKPIGYCRRPPHVHFKVIADGYRSLTTAMYFAGENAEGGFYQRLFGGFSKERDLLTVIPRSIRVGSAEMLDVAFDIVLEQNNKR